MIKKITKMIALTALLVFANANAQDSEKIINSKITEVRYEGKLRPSLEYVIDVDFKTLDDHWKNFLEESYDADVKEKSDKYLIAKDFVVSSISDMRMDMLVVVKKEGEQSAANFAGAFGYDIYIDEQTYPEELSAFKIIIEKFLFDSCNMYYHENLASLSKEIAKINKNSEGLISDNTKLNTKIIDANTQLKLLEESGSSSKITKKIKKLTKKKISYESKITGNKENVSKNHQGIEKLKEKVEFFKERQTLLNAR